MRLFRLLLLFLLIPLSACALNARGDLLTSSIALPYTLDSGDIVRVTVYGEAELSRSYRVDDSGKVAMPLVGTVAVRGKTTQAAGNAISAALAAGYIRDPSVAVEIDTYRPFYIQGEVKNSGQFPYSYGMTVRAAISVAGGYSDNASRGLVTVYRRQGDEVLKGMLAPDAVIQPGDTIVVGKGVL
jgi:polysaccharide export outer membrane protein